MITYIILKINSLSFLIRTDLPGRSNDSLLLRAGERVLKICQNFYSLKCPV